MRALPEQHVDKILISCGVDFGKESDSAATAFVSIDAIRTAVQKAFKIGLDYDLMHATLKQGEENHEHAKR